MFFCDWFSQMELSVLSRNREVLGRRETLHNCHSPVHTAGCKAGRSPQKCPHLKTEVFIWSTSGKRGAVMDYSWDWHGGTHPSSQGEAAVHWDWGDHQRMKKTSRFMSQAQGFKFVLMLGEVQGLCPTPPRKGKPQKKTEMKRKQVNKCGFTETEEQFILSTASENLENIWKSQKTS